MSSIGQFENVRQKSLDIYKGISPKGISDFSQCHIFNILYGTGVSVLL